ncbi:MAG: metallophosphoesterase [Phormidesmis sp.]
MARSVIRPRLSQQVQGFYLNQLQGGIDQTQLRIADGPVGAAPFSFMVIGDTDAGISSNANCAAFSAAFAAQLMQHLGDSRLLLHTGDVTYPIGSYENYLNGFLRPYQSLLSRLPNSPSDRSEPIVFNRPLLPVPGNHDYAESNSKLWQGVLRRVCDRLRAVGIDFGHYGGQGGEAYGQTFLDDLKKLTSEQLTTHLATHYSAVVTDGIAGNRAVDSSSDRPQHCLNYRPGQFTRLPNRYYRFRYGGVDFFALDSNTWNTDPAAKNFDQQQLSWLKQALIRSWQTPNTVGRIIYLHHSPYTTESSRWQQPQALWVRWHLQTVLDQVIAELETKGAANPIASSLRLQHNPLVDLVISGHAHCLEHLRTTNTGHADAYINWLVCGGSGADIRRQRSAGADILGKVVSKGKPHASVVARSQLYAGLHGHNRSQQRFHSFLRIEVQPNQSQKLLVRPFVVSRESEGWLTKALAPIRVGQPYTELSAAVRKEIS